MTRTNLRQPSYSISFKMMMFIMTLGNALAGTVNKFFYFKFANEDNHYALGIFDNQPESGRIDLWNQRMNNRLASHFLDMVEIPPFFDMGVMELECDFFDRSTQYETGLYRRSNSSAAVVGKLKEFTEFVNSSCYEGISTLQVILAIAIPVVLAFCLYSLCTGGWRCPQNSVSQNQNAFYANRRADEPLSEIKEEKIPAPARSQRL